VSPGTAPTFSVAGTLPALRKMSKTFSLLRFRLAAALALMLSACAVVAAPASAAAPPIGTSYCMDGHFTFTTWDLASQHVADKVVKQFSGYFTDAEVDPANVFRPALQQFWDALETSDAIGNYGVDTTIPGYKVHTIALGICSPADNYDFLCYSKFNDVPGVWPDEEAQSLIDEGYWSPTAMDGNVAGGTNIGAYHLVCNPPAASISFASVADPVTLYVGGDGTPVGGAGAGNPGYYPLSPLNR